MRKTGILLAIFVSMITPLIQAQQNDKYFDLGVNAFQSGNYKQATEYFTTSINLSPATNAIMNRAVCFYYLGDTCRFCEDLNFAYQSGDKKAGDMYKENCTLTRLIPLVHDSIKKLDPRAEHLEVIYHRCHDSIVNIVFSDGKTTWSRELTRYFLESKEIQDVTKGLDGVVFTIVESMPSFPGGEDARNRFLAENIVYPMKATNNGIQGTVYVSFVIDKNGNVTNVKVIRGIGGGCDEESVRVIKLMPRWIPGTQDGKPVNVLFNMPIYYRLEGPAFQKRNK